MEGNGGSVIEGSIELGRIVVVPAARQAFVDGRPIDLGGRTFDLLLVLAQAPGVVVSKADISAKLWPSIPVENGSLRFQVAALRRALGSARSAIKTVAGRGYLLASETQQSSASRRESPPPAGTALRNQQPVWALVVWEPDGRLRDAILSVVREHRGRADVFNVKRPSDAPNVR
jgi:DNA-binding winged helix-turn-helix (wHTH) protein